MLADKLKNKKLILASQSPRRKELLQGLNVSFTTFSKDVDEAFPYDMPVIEIAEYLANKNKKVIIKDIDDIIIEVKKEYGNLFSYEII